MTNLRFSFLQVPAGLDSYGKTEQANLCLQHAINTLRRLGNNADADAIAFAWYGCGRDEHTLALFHQVYALN